MDRPLSEKPEEQPKVLPRLREDLELVQGAPLANGAPTWVIFDPPANKHYEIDRQSRDILTLWQAGTVEGLQQRYLTEHEEPVSEDTISELAHFVIKNALILDVPDGNYKAMVDEVQAGRNAAVKSLLKSYLFFRIPLVRPDRGLRLIWPLVSFLFTKASAVLIATLGVIGLYLVSRQWDQFTGTFQYMMSMEGVAYFGLSIVLVKSLHELGHAFMAVKYGVRVPSIGIAFMVLFPILYTDTSGAWRLRSRKERLLIDGAGVIVELALACIATFLWVFMPDGGVRLALFAIATTGWVTSLVVNLNPLMRFDGYYVLSDSLGIQNLQARGFEIARWRLRQLLFATDEPPPETMIAPMRRLLTVHAWATWIYRLFLFLGIALIVYAFFIKVVGILLFIVEIVYFVLRPVGREMMRWWSMRSNIMRTRRTLVTASVFLALVIGAVLPWSTRVSVPSVLVAGAEARLFPPFPSQISQVAVEPGKHVEVGDVLYRLSSPDVETKAGLVVEKINLLEERIARIASDEQDRATLVVLKNELEAARQEQRGYEERLAELTITAPIAGTVTDLDPELQTGMWVKRTTSLGLIIDERQQAVKAYVAETDLFRVSIGATAQFVPDDLALSPMPLSVESISYAAAETLDQPYLAVQFGGGIATAETKDGGLKMLDGHYAVAMKPAVNGARSFSGRTVRGRTLIEGEPESLFERAKRRVIRVLIREMNI
ncbi:MAG: HlyD family efflux transporter periplasmic adaptor subunit [Pseudomonadota bacterium]